MSMFPRMIFALVLALGGVASGKGARAQDAAPRESAVDPEIAAYAACGQRQATALARAGASRGFAAVESSLATACRAELSALREALLENGLTPEATARAMRAVQARVRPQLRSAFDATVSEARRQRDVSPAPSDATAEGEAHGTPAVPPVATLVPLPLPRPRELEVPTEATGSLRPDPTPPVGPQPPAEPLRAIEARGAAPAATVAGPTGQAGAGGLPAERAPDRTTAFVAAPPAARTSPEPSVPVAPTPPPATAEGLVRPPVSIGGLGVDSVPTTQAASPPSGSVAAVEAPQAAQVPAAAAETSGSTVDGVTRIARSVPAADRIRLLDSAIGLHRVCLARAVLGLKPAGGQVELVAQVVDACRPQQEARVAREIDVDGSPDPMIRQRIERDVADVTRVEASELMTLLRGSQR